MAVWRLRNGSDLSDWLVAVLVTAAAEAEVLLTPTAGHGSPGVRTITSLGLLAVAWRRRLPLVSVAFACTSTILSQLVGGWAQDVVPLLTVFLLAYSLGAHAGNLALVVGAFVIGSTPLTLHALGSHSGFSRIESLTWVFGVETVLPIMVGRLVRSRARLIARLGEQNLALVEERKSRALEATLDERFRLAAQLHGMIGDCIDAILAEVTVAEADPGPRGLASVKHLETIGRETLVSMRRILLVLTSADAR